MNPIRQTSRREFLQQAGLAAAVMTTAVGCASQSTVPIVDPGPITTTPWYKRTYRWAQTNITEVDPPNYDIAWWRQHWKRTEVQGIIVNAAGIVAYYPSKYPLQYRAQQLGDRDLFGELAKAAHDDGLVVVARMDSSKAHEPMYKAHPDWFAVDASGQPYTNSGLYVTCINGPYYEQFIPDIMREIIERSHPEGFTDNMWAGPARGSICYCANCKKRFADFSGGKEIPQQANWNDAVYRKWIEWSYARRAEIWDLNNKVTRDAGGPTCVWSGMNSASMVEQSSTLRPYKEIMSRAEITFLDHQSRPEADGLADNAFVGKMIHSVLGWDKLAPDSMAMYQHGRPAQFRTVAKSEPEARLWMLSGFAGGIQPWYHHVGAYSEDKRSYATAEPIMEWHKANERYLVNRKPVATVGLVWSQQNLDFFGRDNAEQLVMQPMRGFTLAMQRARIPFVPLHIENLEKESAGLSTLILPNFGAMSEEQVAQVRKFVERGGSLIASGQTSLYDTYGDPRADFALADLFGVKGGRPVAARGGRRGGGVGAPGTEPGGFGAGGAQHTYLRLTPELRGAAYGPKSPDEPAITGKRHPIFAGFDQTDILEFGGTLAQGLTVDSAAQTLLTFIPSFPTSPPETAWMRTSHTGIPGLVVNESHSHRVVYLAADLDRQYATNLFPDHGNLLANIVRWAARDSIPLEVKGRGLIDCELYQQSGRLILHLVNITGAGTWRAPMDELIPIGPIDVRVKLPAGISAKNARQLVAGGSHSARIENGWASLSVQSILDHEVVVFE